MTKHVRGFKTAAENNAYEAGRQYGLYGFGGEKRHRICTTPERTRAWELGKQDGEQENNNLMRSADR